MPNGNPYKKVFGGDKLVIAAKAWNTLMDVAQDANGNTAVGDGPINFSRGRSVVAVQNNSGINLDRFAVLGVADVVFSHSSNADEFLRAVTLSGAVPTSLTLNNFVILAGPIPDNGTLPGFIGAAFASGVCPALINMTSTTHHFATATNGTTGWLTSASAGSAQILTVASGTGNQWGVVRLGNDISGALTPLTTIGGNTEGSETADTASWARGDHAVEVWATSRVVYNDAGDQILYAFVRKWTYDTTGLLSSISGETRITVDTPGAC